MNDLKLTAKKRVLTGKKVKSLREEGGLPAIAYGHNSPSELITLDAKLTERVYSNAGNAKLVGFKIEDGKERNVIFQEVQLDGRTGSIIHADLYLVRMDELLEAEVPLHFVGESTAVYQDEGTLMKNMETIQVKCLPGDLPDSIEVDISVLDDFEKQIYVSDLVAPKGVEFLVEEPSTELVVKVEPPRSDAEMADLDAEIDEASQIPDSAKEESPAVVSEENEGTADRRDKK
jgi:large subunit ribosomal protein L25